jgi:hypothetical protein
MVTHEFYEMFRDAGLPEDQIDGVLSYFHAFDSASEIFTLTECTTAKDTYAVMDRQMPPKDVHSPVARYVISLGARITEWEEKLPPLTP